MDQLRSFSLLSGSLPSNPRIDDPNDAFWLAQTYFMTHRYSRAERLLTRPFPTKPPAVPFDLKGKAREPDFPPRLPVGPTAMIEVAAEQQEGVSRLVDMSVVCRYLAAQCLVRQGKWAEATEMLGEANPFRNSGASPVSAWQCSSVLIRDQVAVDPRCPIPTEVSR
jgi:hypothetical protein